tara:strand:+ start:42 stop:617 length:576 start_codon:yes stop_codon:yes gene_type:complete
MATSQATRTYPGQVIPADPTAANFEADFRTNTETVMTAVKDVDDEVSVARTGTSASYTTLKARLDYIESTTGASASYWEAESGFTASAGNSFFTVSTDKTSTYKANRPIRIITSSGIFYAYVGSSSYTILTTVNLISNNTNAAFTIQGTVSSIAYASQQYEALWLYDAANLSASALNTINGTSVAMAIALG